MTAGKEGAVDVLAVHARIDLTPEMVAAAYWNLESDGQAQFFAELDRIAGVKLCFQTAWVVNSIAERNDTAAMNAFRTMFAHAEGYPEAAAAWRAVHAKAALARVTGGKA